MNTLHLEKGPFSNLYGLFIGQLLALHEAEQQIVKGGYTIALTITLMLLAAGGAYFVEQERLKRAEIQYESQIDQREKAIESLTQEDKTVQGNMTEVTKERDQAVDYISTLQSRLTNAINERDVALGYDHLPKSTLVLNP